MTAFKNFSAFYSFYLGEHRNTVCRRLHFMGSALALGCFVMIWHSGDWRWLLVGLLTGYSFAWVGHFFFEKNRPATFKHPFYSFVGDWLMFKDILIGRIKF